MIPITNTISNALAIIPARSTSSGVAFGESGGGKVTEYKYNNIRTKDPVNPIQFKIKDFL
jgi:hypothetical protein